MTFGSIYVLRMSGMCRFLIQQLMYMMCIRSSMIVWTSELDLFKLHVHVIINFSCVQRARMYVCMYTKG